MQEIKDKEQVLAKLTGLLGAEQDKKVSSQLLSVKSIQFRES